MAFFRMWFRSGSRIQIGGALILAAAFGGAACTEDFDPYNRLTGRRVLAIRSDPPLPAPGETAILTPLIFDPDPEVILSFAWSWCPMPGPPDMGYPCFVTDEMVDQLAQSGLQLPPFDMGTGPTAKLPHSIDPLILGALCDGAPGLPQVPNCEGGFPVQVKLTVRTPDQELVAVRELRLRFKPDAEPNTNPTIEGLVAEPEGEAAKPILEDATVTIPRAKETTLRVMIPESASEEYQGLDNDRQPARVHEQLALTWFVESGTTDHEHTSFIFDAVPLEDAAQNKWTPSRTKKYARDTARVIVVLRDSRGGVAWREGKVQLGPDPEPKK